MLYLIQLRSQFGAPEDFWPEHSIVFEHPDENLDEGPDMQAFYTGKRTKPLNFGESLNKFLQDAGYSKDEYFITIEKVEQWQQPSQDLAKDLATALAKVLRDQDGEDYDDEDDKDAGAAGTPVAPAPGYPNYPGLDAEEIAVLNDGMAQSILAKLRARRNDGLSHMNMRASDIAYLLYVPVGSDVKRGLEKLVETGRLTAQRENGVQTYSLV